MTYLMHLGYFFEEVNIYKINKKKNQQNLFKVEMS